VVIGEGARIERGARIVRSVVLAGAHARGTVHSAIVTKKATYPITLPEGA
jgi:NDP-sugar pyrophosphorylase family protein